VHFDRTAPPIAIAKGVFTPWNTQNTAFHYDAFFGLLVPMSTPFRVCDIWRSYWAQRLLWEIGGDLCFLGPTVVQIRNTHNYFLDFLDELDLYRDAGRLVRVLATWRPSSFESKSAFESPPEESSEGKQKGGQELPSMMVELAKVMQHNRFWASSDVELMEAWVEDLTSVGYRFPEVVGGPASHPR